MTDAEILVKWRASYPYVNFSTAMELEKLERHFGHPRK